MSVYLIVVNKEISEIVSIYKISPIEAVGMHSNERTRYIFNYIQFDLFHYFA